MHPKNVEGSYSQLIADKLDLTINIIENYFFGTEGDCGEQLFINFSKEHKEMFINSPKP
jgi:hypothetical protein